MDLGFKKECFLYSSKINIFRVTMLKVVLIIYYYRAELHHKKNFKIIKGLIKKRQLQVLVFTLLFQ